MVRILDTNTITNLISGIEQPQYRAALLPKLLEMAHLCQEPVLQIIDNFNAFANNPEFKSEFQSNCQTSFGGGLVKIVSDFIDSFNTAAKERGQRYQADIDSKLLSLAKDMDKLIGNRDNRPSFEQVFGSEVKPFVEKQIEFRIEILKDEKKAIFEELLWEPLTDIVGEPVVDNYNRNPVPYSEDLSETSEEEEDEVVASLDMMEVVFESSKAAEPATVTLNMTCESADQEIRNIENQANQVSST